MDESPTSANLENNHGFIIKKKIVSPLVRGFLRKPEAKRVYTPSGQYHTTVESRVYLTIKPYH